MTRKILIMGLPGAGKTTLARVLAPMLKAVLFNADEVRANINRELGFSHEDRIEHARRMGWLCDRVVESGGTAIADFICPTPETRTAFGGAFIVFVDRIEKGRFEDTNRLFIPPAAYDVRVGPEGWPRVLGGSDLRPALEAVEPPGRLGLTDRVEARRDCSAWKAAGQSSSILSMSSPSWFPIPSKPSRSASRAGRCSKPASSRLSTSGRSRKLAKPNTSKNFRVVT